MPAADLVPQYHRVRPVKVRSGVALVAAIAGVAVLVACSTGDGPRAADSSPSVVSIDNPWDAVVSCLEDAGYPGFVADGSGITAPPGSSDDEAQFQLLLAAESLCADEAGFYSGPIPSDELPRLYALELDEIACLEALGYDAPPTPSLQTFVDNYSSGEPWEAAFTVYNALPRSEQTEDVLDRINTQCPPPASRFVRE